jgi:hypothetical protein
MKVYGTTRDLSKPPGMGVTPTLEKIYSHPGKLTVLPPSGWESKMRLWDWATVERRRPSTCDILHGQPDKSVTSMCVHSTHFPRLLTSQRHDEVLCLQ